MEETMSSFLLTTVLLSLLALVASVPAVEYSYTGTRGPNHWGELKPEWTECKLGRNQSPIAIHDKHVVVNSGLKQLRPSYVNTTWSLLSLQYIYKVFLSGEHCSLPMNGTTYVLSDFHIHTPSEHTIDGNRYPLELHLVHLYHNTSQWKVAVVSKLFSLGRRDRLLHLFLNMQTGKNISMNIGNLMNTNGGYYRYTGSLTTPPCTEGVEWRILKETGTISAGQLKRTKRLLQGVNARPIQRSNGRPVYKANY